MNRPRNALFRTALLAFLLLCSSTLLAFFSHTVEVSQQELQQQLDAMGTLQHKEPLISVIISHPTIELQQDSSKIGLKGDVETVLLGSMKANANLHVRGNIRYNPEQGAFFMTDIEVVSLQSAQIPPQQISNVKRIVQNLLNPVLQQQPVYILKDDNLQEQLAKAVLKDVTVNNGKLLLTLSVL